jgi:2-deoxy-D-gluconate 3-dehydrogenase
MGILDQFKLSGKIALVTGCSRGIGKAMAEGLAEAGADIIGVSASLKPGSDVQSSIESLGKKFYPYQCDFSSRENLYEFIIQVKKDFSTIDILVNNAGTILRKPAAAHSDEYWDEVIAINQTSPFILTREIGKEMIARGSGKIIFTASIINFSGRD